MKLSSLRGRVTILLEKALKLIFLGTFFHGLDDDLNYMKKVIN